MTRSAIALFALLGALVLTGSTAAAIPDDGVVEGLVVNATAGGKPPRGNRVSLLTFDVEAQTQVGERTVISGDDGSFSFSGVGRDPQLAHLVIAEHDAVSYPAATPFQMKDAPLYRSDVRVFDATSSEEMLRFERVNLMVVGAQPGLLQVFQMGALSNLGDRTYVTPNPQDGRLARAVRFGLPQGALQAQFQAGFRDADVLDAVGGIQSTTPLKPGRHEFALSFFVPYTGSEADLTLQLAYPAVTFTLYAPDGGARLDSGLLVPRGRGEFGGQSFQLYSVQSLQQGAVIPARLSGLAWGGGAGLEPNQLALISLAAVLLVIGGGLLLAGRLRAPHVVPTSVPVGSRDEERLQLVLRLALLDERHAAGEIGEAEYQAERGREKARLVALTRAQAVAGPLRAAPGRE